MSTPSFLAENMVKGMVVVSATRGIWCSCATLARAARSATSICGLVIISTKMQQVLSSTACFTFSMSVRSVVWRPTPNFLSERLSKSKVLPNMCVDDTTFLPLAVSASMMLLMAAMPLLSAVTLNASVRARTRSSKLSTVGFSQRE